MARQLDLEVLRPIDVDEIRAAGPSRLLQLDIRGISLGALVDLAVAGVTWISDGDSDRIQLIRKWSSRNSLLADAMGRLSTARNDAVPDHWSAPMRELWVVTDTESWEGATGTDFQQRFSRSLAQSGFPNTLGLALSKAVGEMASNAIEHSGADFEHGVRALVGYHVDQDWMSFAVGDCGKGVLESLRLNPRWAGLAESDEALLKAVSEGATRKPQNPLGDGFEQVHRAVADRNAVLRFRSGDAVLTIDGTQASRHHLLGSCPPMKGLQLSVVCALGRRPEARAL